MVTTAELTGSGIQTVYEGLAPVGGFVNGCGEAAVLMASQFYRGQKVDPNALLNLIKLSIATGHATKSGRHQGATDAADLQWLFQQQGIKAKVGRGESWRSTSDAALANGKPVVLGLANARALGGNNSNVDGHYITLIQTDGDKYLALDPNQPQARDDKGVIYTADTIQKAKPFATVVPQDSPVGVGVLGLGATQLGLGVGEAVGVAGRNDCVHSISVFGSSICLDAGLDLLIRGSLVTAGALLILMAILLFTAKQAEPELAQGAKLATALA